MNFWNLLIALFLVTQGAFADQNKVHVPSEGNAGFISPDERLGERLDKISLQKRILDKSSTLMGKMNQYRTSMNESYSRSYRLLFKNSSNSQRQNIKSLDQFLKNSSNLRNADKSISIRKVTKAIQSHSDFNASKMSKEGLSKVAHRIQEWDNFQKKEFKAFQEINDIRKSLHKKPIKGHKTSLVKNIIDSKPAFLIENSIKEKQALTDKLLKRKIFKNKAEIKLAIKNNDPRVAKLIQLENKIVKLSNTLEAKNKIPGLDKVQKVVKDTVHTIKTTKSANQIRSYLDKVPVSEARIKYYRSLRQKLVVDIKGSLNLDASEIKKALSNPKNQDPKIIKLRNLENKIAKTRYELKMQKLPGIENSKTFSKKWETVNKKITKLREAKSYLNHFDKTNKNGLEAIKLLQKQSYLKQAQMRFQHELIVDGTFKDLASLKKGIKTGAKNDPRIKSLKIIQKSLAEVNLKSTRVTSGRYGSVVRDMNVAREASITHRVKTKISSIADAIKGKIKSGYQVSHGKLADGREFIKTKAANGLEVIKVKTKNGFEITKIKTKQGMEWTKSRSNNAKGYLKGAVDKGWKYVGDKSTSVNKLLKAQSKIAGNKIATQLSNSKNYLTQKVNGAKQFSYNTLKSGMEVTRGAYKNGTQYVSTKAKNGVEVIRTQTKNGWQITKVKTKSGMEWISKRSSDAKGYLKGAKDAGWKYVGDKTTSAVEITKAKAKLSQDFIKRTVNNTKSTLISTATKTKAAINNGVNQVKAQANNAWEITRGKYQNGKEYIKTKSAQGVEVLRVKTKNGWKVSKIKMNNGVQWTKNTASNIKGGVNKGWTQVQNKAQQLGAAAKAQTSAKAKQFSKAIKQSQAFIGDVTKSSKAFVSSKLQNGWQVTKGTLKNGSNFIKTKAANGFEVVKVKTQNSWKVVKVKTAAGMEWSAKRTSDAKGYLKGAADKGWKASSAKIKTAGDYIAAKAEPAGKFVSKQLATVKKLGGQRWDVTQAQINAKVKAAYQKSTQFVKNGISNTKSAIKYGLGEPKFASANRAKVQNYSKQNTTNFSKAKMAPAAATTKVSFNSTTKPPVNSGGATTAPKAGIIKQTLIDTIGKPAQAMAKAIKTGNIRELFTSTKKAGNAVVDKVLGGGGKDGKTGYQVKQQSIIEAVTSKVTQIKTDIKTNNAKILELQASGGSKGKISKLSKQNAKYESLKGSLETELKLAKNGPDILKQMNHLKNLKATGAPKDQISAAKSRLEGMRKDSPAIAKSYVRDGIKFAIMSAAVQGILNIVDQVKKGEKVSIGSALEFVATPQFMLGTSGAFVGGVVAQKLIATGMGKIMMATIQNMVPGPLKMVVNILPYTIGAMVGADLMTGTLGERSIGEMLTNGIGSTVGMALGMALGPVGSIGGAVLGGMIADKLYAAFTGKEEDPVAAETRMLFEPKWTAFSNEEYQEIDSGDYSLEENNTRSAGFIEPILGELNSLEDLQTAKNQAYELYTQEIDKSGTNSETTQKAFDAYKAISDKLELLVKEQSSQ
ncbi:MAG: hypothetical protein COB02_03050 [Candidatus Cloacimonadota bacterium]|nr:MAG: hypothetical protein COB02_03050 [Candidatus Cloacimonadota bacterium]